MYVPCMVLNYVDEATAQWFLSLADSLKPKPRVKEGNRQPWGIVFAYLLNYEENP